MNDLDTGQVTLEIPPEYQKCCVCTGDFWKAEAKSLHPIPNHNAVVQMRWFSFIRRSRGPDWTPKDDDNMPLVCSLHFTSRSYYPSSLRLKANVVPFLDAKELCKRKGRQGSDSIYKNNLGKNCLSDDKPEAFGNPRDIPVIEPQRPRNEVLQPAGVTEQARTICILSEPDFSEFSETNKTSGILFDLETRENLPDPEPETFAFCPEPVLINSPTFEGSTLRLIAVPEVPSDVGIEFGELQGPRKKSYKKSMNRARKRNYPKKNAIVLPKSSSLGCQNDVIQKPLFLLPAVNHSSEVSLHSETFQSIAGVDTTEPAMFSFLDIDNLQRISEVKSGISISKVINFCLVCGDLLNQDLGIKAEEMRKSREILFNLLNFRANESEISELYPICLQCNMKVLDLQKQLDALLEIQGQLEQQRNNLLQDIVRTFCIRSQKNVGLSFASSAAVHEYITQKWASTLCPPYQQFSPDWNKDVDLVKNVISERKKKRMENRRKNSLKKRLARETEIEKAELLVQQKREERRRMLAETRERRLRGEKVRRYRSDERTQCSICQLELQKLSLRKHMLIHNNDARHGCSVCSKSFLRLDALRNHELTHKIGDVSFGQVGRSFQCPYCDMILLGGKRYFQHVATSHLSSSEGQVDISIFYDCDAKENLILHEQIHTSPETVHDCIYCHRYFESESELKIHQFLHQICVDPQALKFICEQCGAKFVTRTQLFSHRSYHSRSKVRLGGGIRKYQLCICEVCGAEFNAESRLKMHSYEHTHPEGFGCDQCHQIFPNPTKLWFHQKRKNNCVNVADNTINSTRPKRRIVSKAKKNIFKRAVVLKKPKAATKDPATLYPKQSINTEFPEKSDAICEPKVYKKNIYPCKHCSVTVKNLYILRRHNLLFHPEIYVDGKTFICPVCWKNYPVQEELDEHCHTVHDRSKCKVCNKLFPSLAKLEQHMRTHTGEKPYRCQFCGKCFNLETNLKEHELRHTGNRPYRCSYCSCGFFRKKQLQQHLEKIHPQTEVQQQVIHSSDGPPSIEINSCPEPHPIVENVIDTQ
ncbi:unnamed protein product, partial [Allacma fusca]